MQYQFYYYFHNQQVKQTLHSRMDFDFCELKNAVLAATAPTAISTCETLRV